MDFILGQWLIVSMVWLEVREWAREREEEPEEASAELILHNLELHV